MDAQVEELKEACVPVSTEECRGCADPCDQGGWCTSRVLVAVISLMLVGHEEYPSRFTVDMETEMLGSVKPYHRQVRLGT